MYVVRDRIVATWEPGRWPSGLLTGRDDQAGGFALEHVVVFPGAPATALMDMLRDGLAEAWEQGFKYVTWHVPHAFPLSIALAEVGRRLGFEKVDEDRTNAYFIRYAP